MTSSPTVAIAAAVLGTPFRIAFGGSTLYQYAQDVAKTLLIASRAAPDGARVFNLGGSPVAIEDWIDAIEAVVPGAGELITNEPSPLPFPSDIQHDALAALGDVPVTPYRDAIAGYNLPEPQSWTTDTIQPPLLATALRTVWEAGRSKALLDQLLPRVRRYYDAA